MIVALAEEHIGGFRSAVDSVARELKYLAMIEAPPHHEIRKFCLESIATGVPQFVAVVDDKVVGWCDVFPKPRPTLRHSGVLGMGVIEGYRGRGIGSELMSATLQAAKARRLTRIELTVRIDNQRAKRLYERFGFVTEALCRRHMLVNGEYKDSYLMALVYD
jgi:RimJ/RimL family protein N-acetyltransferase